MEMGLRDARVIVTGGTRGIGLAIALAFAAEGAHVAVCGRTGADVDSTVGSIRATGVSGFGAAVDVGEPTAYAAFLADATEALGGVDVFVANASAQTSTSDEAGWTTSFDVDVMHTVRGVAALRPELAASDRAAIVMISTISLLSSSTPSMAHAYGSMKAAIASYAGKLAQEVGPEGIRVNVVSPGPVEFPGGQWERMKTIMPPVYEGALRLSAVGRMGRPEDVADAVVFLASPRASYITGTTVRVDGGTHKSVDW